MFFGARSRSVAVYSLLSVSLGQLLFATLVTLQPSIRAQRVCAWLLAVVPALLLLLVHNGEHDARVLMLWRAPKSSTDVAPDLFEEQGKQGFGNPTEQGETGAHDLFHDHFQHARDSARQYAVPGFLQLQLGKLDAVGQGLPGFDTTSSEGGGGGGGDTPPGAEEWFVRSARLRALSAPGAKADVVFELTAGASGQLAVEHRTPLPCPPPRPCPAPPRAMCACVRVCAASPIKPRLRPVPASCGRPRAGAARCVRACAARGAGWVVADEEGQAGQAAEGAGARAPAAARSRGGGGARTAAPGSAASRVAAPAAAGALAAATDWSSAHRASAGDARGLGGQPAQLPLSQLAAQGFALPRPRSHLLFSRG